MQVVETIGNLELMNREKTLFLCSKKTPIELYEPVFQWTDSLTSKDCVACFNSTDMESEVLKALLVSEIPTILFVMNRFTDVYNLQIERALHDNRMLIVVLKRDEPRGSGLTPKLRNQYVLSICQHIVCGYINKNGSIFSLLAGRDNLKKLVDDSDLGFVAAELDRRYIRWTVAQDKVLLRMYYMDMGIHAIHKRLGRSYSAIYTRIRSITQSEYSLKGREFEDFVLNLFDNQVGNLLVLKEWQGDKSLGKLRPENNKHPDFVFIYEGKEFAVECKWRKILGSNLSKELFPEKTLKNYRKFCKERNIPVTIVLGVGGEPCAPELLYFIPLEKIDAIISHTQSIMDFLADSYSISSLLL